MLDAIAAMATRFEKRPTPINREQAFSIQPSTFSESARSMLSVER
jgi:hypothetical protein